MFKDSFRFYKTKYLVPDFSEVIDFEEDCNKKLAQIHPTNLKVRPPWVIPIEHWKCYKLLNHPGLIFIRNPFSVYGQRYIICRCLRDYSKSPNINNLSTKSFEKNVIDNWWYSLQQKCSNLNSYKKLKDSMRWTTLGYQHNWNTKIYTESMKHKFPDDLAELSKFFAKCLGYTTFSAEAAIVNYYPMGTSLAGHIDNSECDLEAPLISFSFGQTAVFLIGGKTKAEKPTAIFLRSGDLVIMSEESRSCYHAVPRIMKCDKEPWNYLTQENKATFISKEMCALPITNLSEQNDIKCDTQNEIFYLNEELWNSCKDEHFWKSFNNYVKDSRININVRQVLKKDQNCL